MKLTSIIAIFVLFWVMAAFLVLPFGVRTHYEAGVEKIPGQADSAPVSFSPARVAKRATGLAVILFGLFYANYTYGWITMDMFDLYSD